MTTVMILRFMHVYWIKASLYRLDIGTE